MNDLPEEESIDTPVSSNGVKASQVGVFEIADFTTASAWEKFISDIEQILQKWELTGQHIFNSSSQHSKSLSKLTPSYDFEMMTREFEDPSKNIAKWHQKDQRRYQELDEEIHLKSTVITFDESEFLLKYQLIPTDSSCFDQVFMYTDSQMWHEQTYLNCSYTKNAFLPFSKNQRTCWNSESLSDLTPTKNIMDVPMLNLHQKCQQKSVLVVIPLTLSPQMQERKSNLSTGSMASNMNFFQQDLMMNSSSCRLVFSSLIIALQNVQCPIPTFLMKCLPNPFRLAQMATNSSSNSFLPLSTSNSLRMSSKEMEDEMFWAGISIQTGIESRFKYSHLEYLPRKCSTLQEMCDAFRTRHGLTPLTLDATPKESEGIVQLSSRQTFTTQTFVGQPWRCDLDDKQSTISRKSSNIPTLTFGPLQDLIKNVSLIKTSDFQIYNESQLMLKPKYYDLSVEFHCGDDKIDSKSRSGLHLSNTFDKWCKSWKVEREAVIRAGGLKLFKQNLLKDKLDFLSTEKTNEASVGKAVLNAIQKHRVKSSYSHAQHQDDQNDSDEQSKSADEDSDSFMEGTNIVDSVDINDIIVSLLNDNATSYRSNVNSTEFDSDDSISIPYSHEIQDDEDNSKFDIPKTATLLDTMLPHGCGAPLNSFLFVLVIHLFRVLSGRTLINPVEADSTFGHLIPFLGTFLNVLWPDIVDNLRKQWHEKKQNARSGHGSKVNHSIIPFMDVNISAIDLKRCLLHQKLQMLAYCSIHIPDGKELDKDEDIAARDQPWYQDFGDLLSSVTDLKTTSTENKVLSPSSTSIESFSTELNDNSKESDEEDSGIFFDTMEEMEFDKSPFQSRREDSGSNTERWQVESLQNFYSAPKANVDSTLKTHSNDLHTPIKGEIIDPTQSEGRQTFLYSREWTEKSAIEIWIPETQEASLMTSDMIEDEQEILENMGQGKEGALKRAIYQSASLMSDMQAFKAANNCCELSDFVRWHSPRDWITDTNGSDMNDLSNGHLSSRMMEEDNLWQQLWKKARRIPAKKQNPLLNPIQQGENIIQYLEHLTVFELMTYLLPIIICVAYNTFTQLGHDSSLKILSVAESFHDFAHLIGKIKWTDLLSNFDIDLTQSTSKKEMKHKLRLFDEQIEKLSCILRKIEGQSICAVSLLQKVSSKHEHIPKKLKVSLILKFPGCYPLVDRCLRYDCVALKNSAEVHLALQFIGHRQSKNDMQQDKLNDTYEENDFILLDTSDDIYLPRKEERIFQAFVRRPNPLHSRMCVQRMYFQIDEGVKLTFVDVTSKDETFI